MTWSLKETLVATEITICFKLLCRVDLEAMRSDDKYLLKKLVGVSKNSMTKKWLKREGPRGDECVDVMRVMSLLMEAITLHVNRRFLLKTITMDHFSQTDFRSIFCLCLNKMEMTFNIPPSKKTC